MKNIASSDAAVAAFAGSAFVHSATAGLSGYRRSVTSARSWGGLCPQADQVLIPSLTQAGPSQAQMPSQAQISAPAQISAQVPVSAHAQVAASAQFLAQAQIPAQVRFVAEARVLAEALVLAGSRRGGSGTDFAGMSDTRAFKPSHGSYALSGTG